MKTTSETQGVPMSLSIKVYPVEQQGALVAMASVVLDGCFAVRDIRIMRGRKGLFVVMPSTKYKKGYRDVCFPCTKEFKQRFDRKILEAFRQTQAKQSADGPKESDQALMAE